MTHQYVFDYHDGDVYWCTADVGWVTGHSYIVYGPLANGATTLMFEGVPNYPDASRFWQVVDKHQVNIFYTAPTAIRALMREGEAPVKKTTPQEPAPARLGRRADQSRGLAVVLPRRRRRPLPDRRHLVADRDRRHPDHAAARRDAAEARLGDPAVLRRAAGDGRCRGQGAARAPATGNLCLIDSWPGQMRTVYGDHQRFIETYFTTYPGKYFTGDGARRDEDGYYWITGRVDDVINVSGHRIGTAEVESALVGNTKVAEAAVVGFPHDIKGQGIYAYVTLKAGQDADRGAAQGAGRLGAQGDRPDRHARRHPVGARPAQDALGQDHAPHPAQDRRERFQQSRRHLDARRSRRGRRPGEEPRRNEPDHPAARADLAAGRTTSRKLTEEALARIEDPKGEGKRAFIKVWHEQALAAADASDAAAQGGPRASPLAGHSGLDQEPLRRGGRDHAVGLEGARRRAAGQGRCARGGAPARRRRGDRRQHQHERVRLLGRGLQPALRHAGQSRPTASACPAAPRPARRSRSPTAWPWPHSAPTPAARCAFPPRVCGIVGFKPTARRVPIDGVVPLSTSLDSIGPLANSVECCAIVDAVFAGEPIAVPEAVPLAGLRFARAQALRDGRARRRRSPRPSSAPARRWPPRA